jgi:hypothetical protein
VSNEIKTEIEAADLERTLTLIERIEVAATRATKAIAVMRDAISPQPEQATCPGCVRYGFLETDRVNLVCLRPASCVKAARSPG